MVRATPPKAILVDLDDPIVVYDGVAETCWRQVCRTFAPRIPGIDSDLLFAGIDGASDMFWSDPERIRRGRLDLLETRREIVSAAFTNMGVDGHGLANEIAEVYQQIRVLAIEPIPGAIEAFHKLRLGGIKLGLITNGASGPQHDKIDRFGLRPLFDSILVEGEFGAGKPDHRVYLHALDLLGAPPTGVDGGRQFGVRRGCTPESGHLEAPNQPVVIYHMR